MARAEGGLGDGYTLLPPGKLAAVVTYLEMLEPAAGCPPPLPAGCAVRPFGDRSLDEYRALFRAVGEPWLWFSRLRMDDVALAAALGDPAVDVLVLEQDGVPKGLLEIDRREPPDVEIALLGLTPDLVGIGAGVALLGLGLQRAWSTAPRRVVLHTCSLDHPRALAFYLRAGFRPYARGIEIADDPRLDGTLPRTAAPGVPII